MPCVYSRRPQNGGADAICIPVKLGYIVYEIPISNNQRRFGRERIDMKDAYHVNHWIKTHGDLALDLVRIYLGIGLIVKAAYFMGHSDYLLQLMENIGSLWFAPAILVHYVVLAHLCGGICLVLGLFTRTAAIVQLPILLSAPPYVPMPPMITSLESPPTAEFPPLLNIHHARKRN